MLEPATRRRQRGAALSLRLGFEQVSKSLGFGQVDPAIGERAAREFARLGLAQAIDPTKRGEQGVDHRPSAMALIFNDIFACRAFGRVESEDQGLVDNPAARWFAHCP